jgi:hypothetical protein
MSKQKHDIGNKKRRHAENAEEQTTILNTHALARSLVERGLATRRILDGRTPYPMKTDWKG